MADEQKPNEQKPKKAKKTGESGAKEGILTTTAKAIGAAAGKIAALAGVEAAPKPNTKSVKPLKLQKKNNPHVPRKLKKAQKKADAAAQAKK